MEDVYILITYEYNTFSYSGITEHDWHVHATEQGAIDHAEELGLKIVECCDYADKEATVAKTKLLN